MLDQALAYSNIEWLVFPYWPKTKKPITRRSFKAARLYVSTVALLLTEGAKEVVDDR